MSEHVHKYKKVTMGKNFVVYKCVLPGCTHYVRSELAVGRFSLCWMCEGQFVMTEISATRLKPKCQSCIDKTVARRAFA